jgi:hypothetical protein
MIMTDLINKPGTWLVIAGVAFIAFALGSFPDAAHGIGLAQGQSPSFESRVWQPVTATEIAREIAGEGLSEDGSRLRRISRFEHRPFALEAKGQRQGPGTEYSSSAGWLSSHRPSFSQSGRVCSP